MVYLAALFVFALPQSSGVNVQTDIVTRTVGGREVKFNWPIGTPVIGESLEWNGHRISIGDRGNLLLLDSGRLDWAEIRKNYVEAIGLQTLSTPTWRTKVFLLPRTNILNRGEILRVRRNWMEKEQMDQAFVALAEWAVRVESAMKGKLKVEIDVETDMDENYQDASATSNPFDQNWLQEYCSPRFNGFDFQSDDKIFRGRFDSVWVLHSGLTPFASKAMIWETPVTCVPIANLLAKGEDVSHKIFQIWNEDLRSSAVRLGYQIAPNETSRFQISKQTIDTDLPLTTLERVTANRDSNSAEFTSRFQAKGSTDGVLYAGIQDDPLEKVGLITEAEITQILGAKLAATSQGSSVILTGEGLPMRMISNATTLDPILESDREATALVMGKGKSLLFVRMPFLALFAEKIPDAKFHGFVQIYGIQLGVFAIAETKSGLQECELVGHPKVSQIPQTAISESSDVEFFSGDSTKVKTSGQFTARELPEPGRGTVTLVDFGKAIRVGEAVIFDSRSSNGGIDSRAKPKFSFWIKASQVEPVLLRFEFQNLPSRQIRLFGRWPTPEDCDPTPVGAEIEAIADGNWHQVTVDLRALGPSSGRAIISRVVLSSDPLAEAWGKGMSTSSSLLLGPAAAEATTEPVPVYSSLSASQPDFASINPEDRARWAAAAADTTENIAILLPLLRDRIDFVRTNASAAFQRIRSATAEPALIDALNTLDARQAQATINALQFQNTDTAWSAISRTFLGPPLESHRVFAAIALGDRKLPSTTGSLSTGFASRSWQARLRSAQSIAKMGSRESNLLLIVFMQETDPEIRRFVAENSDVSSETVCRRLQYSAVNDPSDAVRESCHWRLAHSTIASFAIEGWKGIRDDSPFVRLSILNRIFESPTQDARPAIILAVSDVDPRVRAKALLCLSRLPGEVKIEELGQISSDLDVRVQVAFRELMVAKGIGENSLMLSCVK